MSITVVIKTEFKEGKRWLVVEKVEDYDEIWGTPTEGALRLEIGADDTVILAGDQILLMSGTEGETLAKLS